MTYSVATMIPNKRSVGSALQLLYFKSCAGYQNCEFLPRDIFGVFATFWPLYAPSPLLNAPEVVHQSVTDTCLNFQHDQSKNRWFKKALKIIISHCRQSPPTHCFDTDIFYSMLLPCWSHFWVVDTNDTIEMQSLIAYINRHKVGMDPF